ncbi:hypothetical protein [Longispora albida]|uniref:hypothetical protein n=1 Tax=Longispora albida TaxID=203523 RepID=UPI00047720DA|nr:hypothetical protein [Longispora albida]
MTRRCVILLLSPVTWSPPGVDPGAWRLALAEDSADLVSSLAETDAALAYPFGDRALAEAVSWPGMPLYEADTPAGALNAAGRDGYDQAVVLVPDAPDLPAMLIGKLLRPLGSSPLAVAPAVTGGLVGIAARLPYTGELSFADNPPEGAVVTAGWHRLGSPEGLGRLDPALEGWEATRLLLSSPAHHRQAR